MASILIVNDLSSVNELLETVMEPAGHKCLFAGDGERALSLYQSNPIDVVLARLSMEPMDGIALLKELKARDPCSAVILMTRSPETDTVIDALRAGALDYIKIPFRVDELLESLKRAIEYKNSKGNGSEELTVSSGTCGREPVEIEDVLPGSSDKMVSIRRQIAKLVDSGTPVLLQGEAGTGKKAVAEILHRKRYRNERPLVAVNCASCGDGILRANLLGKDNQGGKWIAGAAGGTLVLDNIDSLSMESQEAVVCLIRDRINRFRLICAAGVDLEEKLDKGEFSDELYYRIGTLPVNLPSLREHPSDIPGIVKGLAAWAGALRSDNGKEVQFSDEALEAMTRYRWPGNRSELVQVVTSVVTVSEDHLIGIDRLPFRLRCFRDWPKREEYLAPIERHYIQTVLRACGNDEVRAGGILGCERSRISSRPDFREAESVTG